MDAVMQGKQPAHFTAYRSVKLSRDTQSAGRRVSQQWRSADLYSGRPYGLCRSLLSHVPRSGNKVVILTGTGGEFISGIDFSSFGNVADPAVWSQVHDEGVQILENLTNIRVPVIVAIEGRAHVHSEYAAARN